MAINKVIYGNNTLIDISDTTAVASDVEEGKDFYLNDGTKATGTKILKICSGTFELDADSSTFTQTDIVDKNGNSFTPTMVVAIMTDSAATTHNLGAHRVIAFFKRNYNNTSFAARICTYGSAVDYVRTNPATSGITFGNGQFKYTTGTSAYYLAKGTYAWVAFREE